MSTKPANLVKQFHVLSAKDKVRFWNLIEPAFDKSALGKVTLALIGMSSDFIAFLTTTTKTPNINALAHLVWTESNLVREEVQRILQENKEAPIEIGSAVWQRLADLIEVADAAVEKHLALIDLANKRSKQTSTKREPVNSLVLQLHKKGASPKEIIAALKKAGLKTERKMLYDHRSLSKLLQRLKVQKRI